MLMKKESHQKVYEYMSWAANNGVTQFEDSYKSLINGLEDKFFAKNK